MHEVVGIFITFIVVGYIATPGTCPGVKMTILHGVYGRGHRRR